MVEDTSLVFTALGRLPGTFIRWFLAETGNAGLCKLLDNYTDRSAIATALFGYYDGNRLMTFIGEWPGTIANAPRGANGFGWDPIFIPEGADNPDRKTLAEMTPDEVAANSIRKSALQKLQAALRG